jgi:ornithine cyclodeaminase/alanine dehydrogenase-like protein (mu-crystallin family)
VVNPPAPLVRLLTRSQVRSLLSWPELIEAAERALIAMATGGVAAASSDQLQVPGAALHLKSGALLQPPVLSVKANLRPAAGGSAGLVVVFDPVRCCVRAVLDSADITAMRTGAMTAVAARQLVSPGGHAVAVIGAGPVASQSLAALRHVMEVTAVRLWSRDRARADTLAAGLDLPVTVAGSPDEAAAGASVIVTATPAREPLLHAGSLAAGAVILAMGADTRGKRELAGGVLDGAAIVADTVAGAFEVGECAYLPAGFSQDGCVTLGELAAGLRALPAGRQRTVFDSVGTAVVDAAATGLVLDLADRGAAGQLVAFDS